MGDSETVWHAQPENLKTETEVKKSDTVYRENAMQMAFYSLLHKTHNIQSSCT